MSYFPTECNLEIQHVYVKNISVVNSSVNKRYSRYMCFEAEKWNRTTYSDYSLSWYNLAGEKAKWWDQDRKKEGRKKRERERYVYTSFKVHSADNQAFFWGHHLGTGSESGSPFFPPSFTPSFITFIHGRAGEGNTDKYIIVVLCIGFNTNREKCRYSLG